MGDRLQARWLPDGRFELTLGKCIPVVVRSSTYFSKTESELFCLVGEMTLIAHELKEEHGYDLPLRSGRFVEDGQGKFTLEEDPAPAARPERQRSKGRCGPIRARERACASRGGAPVPAQRVPVPQNPVRVPWRGLWSGGGRRRAPGDGEVGKRLPPVERRLHPLRRPAAAGPGFGGIIRITVFLHHLAARGDSLCRSGLSADGFPGFGEGHLEADLGGKTADLLEGGFRPLSDLTVERRLGVLNELPQVAFVHAFEINRPGIHFPSLC